MSNLSGTNIAAPIVPFTTDDAYPTHYAVYGLGGWKAVATISDRNAIPATRLEDGAVIYVVAEKTPYVYAAGSWIAFFASQSDVVAATRSDTAVTPAAVGPLINGLTSALGSKASSSDLLALTGTVSTKAAASDVSALATTKANKTTTVSVTGPVLTGGGTLGSNVVISAAVASPADVAAGTSGSLVVTPSSLIDVVSSADDTNGVIISLATSIIQMQAMFVDRFSFK